MYLFNFEKRIYNKESVTVPVVTKEQMLELYKIAVGEIASYLFQRMEKAGRNLVLIIIGIISEHLYQTLLKV